MTRRSNTWLSITVAVAALSPLVACSSAPTEPGAASSHEVSPASGAAPLSESDRVHAYLEGRYPSSAVKHSFRTALGQTVDCVDFLQTPGVRAMAARGEPITAMPKPPAPHTRTLRDGTTMTEPLQLAPVSEGVDEDGHDRLCPDGTVLQIRLTPEEIAQEGGLDAYRRARQRHAPPRAPHGASPSSAAATPSGTHAPAGAPPTMWPCQSGEFHDYAHVIGDVVDETPGVAFGMDTMAVYSPAMPQQNGNHIDAQVWMFGGSVAQDLDTDPGCDPRYQDCVQSIEIGWMITASAPQIFIYSTLDGYTLDPSGYALDGCLNGAGSDGNYPCPPFIWGGGFPSTVAPGASIATSGPYSTTPQELSALIIQIAGDYWVQVGVAGQRYYIGYYPGSNFRGPLSTFQVGGEVYDGANDFTNPAVPMGSGMPSWWGFGWSAYHHDFNAMAYANGQQSNFWTASLCASTPPDYSVAPYGYSTSPAPGAPSWTTDGGYFYYGNTPGSCTPRTCTGACGTISDGCGHKLQCAPCPCQPTTCAAQGDDCGSITDGCGHTLQCGTCGTGNTCISNVCECTPRRCPAGTYWNADDCACERPIKCKPGVCQ